MPLRYKLLLSSAAVTALLIGGADLRRHQSAQTETLQVLSSAGLAQDGSRFNQVLSRDPDSVAANEQLAFALIGQLLDPATRQQAASPAQLQALIEDQVQQLDTAESLARDTLELRPNSWRALTAVGAAIYLRRSYRRDDRLIRNYRDWEIPLESARKLAPHRAEPNRFLTMAYLEVWPMLSAEKQQLTREMLVTGFDDPNAYRVSIEPWLQVSSATADSLDLLPQRAWIYDDVRRRFVQRGRLQLAVEATRRYREAVVAESEQQLVRARDAARRGDFVLTRKIIGPAVQQLPREVTHVPLAERLMRALPAGPVPGHGKPALAAWINFNSEQCLLVRCRFSEDLVERFVYVVPDGPQKARALLAMDDLEAATAAETSFEVACSTEAQAYWLHKTRYLLHHASVAEARATLLTCAATQADEHRLLFERLFEALRPGHSTEEALATFGTTTSSHFGQPTWLGSVELALPEGGYEVDLLGVSPAGDDQPSLVELMLDGAMIAAVVLGSEAQVQTIEITATGAPQQLVSRRVAGPRRSLQILEARPRSRTL